VYHYIINPDALKLCVGTQSNLEIRDHKLALLIYDKLNKNWIKKVLDILNNKKIIIKRWV